jgi:hypothetical protein
MLDPVVLLTPLLVLVVLLLLGFAGCTVGEAPLPLSVVVRVPTTLAVTLLQLDWTDPENDMGHFALESPPPSGTVDGNHFFSRVIQRRPSPGAWSVRCQVAVRDNVGDTASGEATCDFMLGASDARTVNFQASGLTFAVTCMGLS